MSLGFGGFLYAALAVAGMVQQPHVQAASVATAVPGCTYSLRESRHYSQSDVVTVLSGEATLRHDADAAVLGEGAHILHSFVAASAVQYDHAPAGDNIDWANWANDIFLTYGTTVRVDNDFPATVGNAYELHCAAGGRLSITER